MCRRWLTVKTKTKETIYNFINIHVIQFFRFCNFSANSFLLYWFVAQKNLKLQNSLIVLSSYVFYGWWDWRFLSLIIFSSFIDYFIGICLSNSENKTRRKLLLLTSILVNLGLLGFLNISIFLLKHLLKHLHS